MTRSMGLRNAVAAGLLVLLACAAGVCGEGSAKSSGDELLAMIPAESLFCVRINNLVYEFISLSEFY